MKKEDIHFDDTMMFNQETMEVLYDYLSPLPAKGRLLELGTGLGHFIKFFSELKPKWFLYSVDAYGLFGDGRVYEKLEHENVSKVFDYLKNQKNIIQILGDSNALPWELPLNVLMIDAGHTYEACKADFDRYSPYLTGDGIIFFDDYLQPGNPTNGVKRVVDEICADGWELLFEGITAAVKREL